MKRHQNLITPKVKHCHIDENNKVNNKKLDTSEKFNFQLLADSNKDSISAVALIRAYRLRGHLLANLDPLEMRKSEYLDELHPEFYGFKKQNYDKKIFLNGVINKKYANIKEILKFLKKTYCGNIGYEFMHVSNPVERKWFRDRVEQDQNALNFTQNGKEAILNKLVQAEGFEKFLATKYVGTKRFGLDGGESLIPALEQIIKIGGGGWKRSLFGDSAMHGMEGIKFYTKLKTITSRWPSGIRSNAEFVMPTMK